MVICFLEALYEMLSTPGVLVNIFSNVYPSPLISPRMCLIVGTFLIIACRVLLIHTEWLLTML